MLYLYPGEHETASVCDLAEVFWYNNSMKFLSDVPLLLQQKSFLHDKLAKSHSIGIALSLVPNSFHRCSPHHLAPRCAVYQQQNQNQFRRFDSQIGRAIERNGIPERKSKPI